ncbi:hypothetical protein ACFX2I_013372 [Malus domestica]
MEIEGVIVEEVLIKFVNLFIQGCLAFTAQRLKGPFVEKHLQVKVQQVPKKGGVDRDSSRGSPQDGSNVKDGGINGAEREDHGVGGRTPKA